MNPSSVSVVLALAGGLAALEGLALGEPEVQNLREAVLGDHDVLGLQIAMDDAGVVCPSKPVGDLHREIEEPLHGERSGGQQIAQRLALDELHRDVGKRARGADLVDRDDVGMVERRHRSGFLLEAPDPVGLGGHRLGQDLEGHVAAEPRVVRPVDLPHAARAEAPADGVGTELPTDEVPAPCGLSRAAHALRVDSVDTPPT